MEAKHSLGKANLSSSRITPEGQSILSLMILYIHRFVNWLLKHHVFVQEWDRGGDLPFRAIDTCMQNFGQV